MEGSASGAATDSNTSLHLRDLWGTGKLAQLERESHRETEPSYTPLTPAPALGNPFAHRVHSVDYTSWPRLPELFPVSFPGIKTSRDPLVVDIDRDRLEARMKQYLDRNLSDAEMAALVPCAMESTARFDAMETRRFLRERGFQPANQNRYTFRPWQIIRYAYRPFDVRWLYWEPQTKLLDEKREEAVAGNHLAIGFVIAQKSRTGYKAPQVTSQLMDLNATDGGANIYRISEFTNNLLAESLDALNETIPASAFVKKIGGAPTDLFFHALAIMHTPQYRTENAGALLGDWPRIPLPATTELLSHSATLGRRLAELLDPESEIELHLAWRFFGRLNLPKSADLTENLKLTAGWGRRGQGSTVMPGPGQSAERPWTETERTRLQTIARTLDLTLDQALALLGETCLDIHLNGSAFWSPVPANVWNYILGGYQVLKKWLSYRELLLLGRPLHPEEAEYLSQVVRRIAAILLLGPALDASYQAILPTATGLPAK